ncbi:hypothetical protein [Nocardia sp. NPDC004750]
MMITPPTGDWVPDSCTLPTVEQSARVAEFDRFFTEAVRRTDRPARTRLDLLLAAGTEEEGRDLAARESGCCSFFTVGFDDTEDGPVMRIAVPDNQAAVLDALAARADAWIGGDRR